MSGAHALFSPSGAHRWMPCPGAPHLEATQPDTSSEYADEGTAAHFLAAVCLKAEKDASAYVGRDIALWVHPESDSSGECFTDELAELATTVIARRVFRVTEDMAMFVQIYIDEVRDAAQGHTLLVEQRVGIEHITGEPGAAGTSDAVVVTSDTEELQVRDLKFGRGVQVYAKDNPQLLLYGIGALREYSLLGDFKRLRVAIHQPRLGHYDEHVYTLADVTAFAKDAKAAAERAQEAGKEVSGMPVAKLADRLDRLKFLTPGEKQCQFCRAKANCPALARYVEQTVKADFAEATPPETAEELAPDTTPGAVLGQKMASVSLVEDWCKAVRAEVETRLMAGDEVPGFKLVEGRRGARSWIDEEEVEKAMKGMRLKKDEMYSFKLISPTQAEKLLKKNPKRWAKLEDKITQSQGKPSVAPESDKRPAITVGATADEFDDETGNDLL